MKVIFLDIDGVLNSAAYDRVRDWRTLSAIDESRLPLLKEIADKTGAKIVLSSTWRCDWEKDPALCREDGTYINQTFAKFGLEVYDKTPYLGLCADRHGEIKKWLNENGADSFVILDDYRYNWAELSDNFVKTNPYRGAGLEEEHVRLAIEILNK